ncbi:MAG: hypothetical protein ACYTFY_17485 [Planctomycetota bacterium]|jgi:hypothetical protein
MKRKRKILLTLAIISVSVPFLYFIIVLNAYEDDSRAESNVSHSASGSMTAIGDYPAGWEDFHYWDFRKKVEKVTRCYGDRSLSEKMVIFFKSEVQNRNLKIQIRKNMAECLVTQKKVDPEVYEILSGIVENPDEYEAWRANVSAMLEKLKPAVTTEGKKN